MNAEDIASVEDAILHSIDNVKVSDYDPTSRPSK